MVAADSVPYSSSDHDRGLHTGRTPVNTSRLLTSYPEVILSRKARWDILVCQVLVCLTGQVPASTRTREDHFLNCSLEGSQGRGPDRARRN
jgi:hypothetical protein